MLENLLDTEVVQATENVQPKGVGSKNVISPI
jgi:hypothetical protein